MHETIMNGTDVDSIGKGLGRDNGAGRSRSQPPLPDPPDAVLGIGICQRMGGGDQKKPRGTSSRGEGRSVQDPLGEMAPQVGVNLRGFKNYEGPE